MVDLKKMSDNYYIPEIMPEYTKKESLFAFAALFMGFGAVRLMILPAMKMKMGLGAALFLTVLTIFGAIFPSDIKYNKKLFNGLTALAIIFSVNVFLTANFIIQFLDAVFVYIIFAYMLLIKSDVKYSGGIRELLLFDILKAVFAAPFCDFGRCGDAMKSVPDISAIWIKVKGALSGLLIAVPSTVIAAELLFSADNEFAVMMNNIFGNFSLDSTVTSVYQIIAGIPIGFAIYSICISSSKGSHADIMNDESCRGCMRKMGIISVNTGFFAVLPTCVLYVIFIFSQARYFFSAFFSELPEGFGYADYARRGFFELAAVLVINIFIISAFNIFCRRENGKKPLSMKIITAVFCTLTIMLAVTAISKMVMYIMNYGLTSKRVYTTWFMALAVMIFICVIAWQFVKINIPKISVIIFTAMFALLSFCRIDYIIADCNITMYENGYIESCDYDMIENLSDDAAGFKRRKGCTDSDWKTETLSGIIYRSAKK